jgi:hypothetical protein
MSFREACAALAEHDRFPHLARSLSDAPRSLLQYNSPPEEAQPLIHAMLTPAAAEGGAVPARSGWELTPKQSVRLECTRRGRDRVVDGCVALLAGRDVDDNLIIALGGPAAMIVLHDGPRQRNQYWRRVWAARGLLHVWDERASDAIVAATADEHWRVREMAAKVIASHAVDAGLEAVARLRSDPVPRVRAAAQRATVLLTAGRH